MPTQGVYEMHEVLLEYSRVYFRYTPCLGRHGSTDLYNRIKYLGIPLYIHR